MDSFVFVLSSIPLYFVFYDMQAESERLSEEDKFIQYPNISTIEQFAINKDTIISL